MSKDGRAPVDNLFANIPQQLPEELFTELLNTNQFRMERIVSRGHTTAAGEWYDQEQHEWVVLLSGSAILAFENGKQRALKPGDYLNIPAHQRHRVEQTSNTQDTVWLAIHYT